MNASKTMAKITTTTQKKNTMMPGMAYPATVLALATTASYPQPCDLFGGKTQGILLVSEQTARPAPVNPGPTTRFMRRAETPI
jgi:hypothetical protein